MAESPFIIFEKSASSRPDVFPGIRYRIAWLEFRALFYALINQPVWNGDPTTCAAWEESTIPSSRFDSIRRWLSNEETGSTVNGPSEMPISAAFALLERYHDLIRNGLKREVGPGRVRSVSSSRNVLGPLPVHFRRSRAVDRLCQTLADAPPSISATMIHGSLADGRVAEGFSDADVLCFVASPIEGEITFWEAAKWLFKLNHQLFAVNPCMHHGPMLAFTDEVHCAAEASLPSAIFQNGFWLAGEISEIFYHDGRYESVAAFSGFEFYFERYHLFVPDIVSAFDALWWTSNLLIIPLLLRQATSGQSIYKRLCLSDPVLAELPEQDRAMVRRLSEIRAALGRWIIHRLPAERAYEPECNPGSVARISHDQLKMTAEEVRLVGISDERMSEARGFWARARTRALNIGFRWLGLDAPIERVRWAWPRSVTNSPRILRSADYDEARTLFLERCRSLPIVGVFEFGEVGCPGLSDLDLCVVLENGFVGIPEELKAEAFPPDIAYVLDHDPLFVSAGMAPQLGAFFPFFATRQLYGGAISLPASNEFPLLFQAAAISCKNLGKYPADLDWLLTRQRLNVRTVLAFVHSFQHVRRGLTQMGLKVPPAVAAAVALDEKYRTQFKNKGMPDDADIFVLVEASMACSQPLRNALVQYWIAAAQRLECNRAVIWPQSSRAATAWVRAELRARTADSGKPSEVPTLYPLLSEYLDAKSAFVASERRRGRIPSVYIDDFRIKTSLG